MRSRIRAKATSSESVTVTSDSDTLPATEGLPLQVSMDLDEAARHAARRLRTLLKDDAEYKKLKPADRLKAIDMALTRGIGTPVRRKVSVVAQTTDSDAVAASIHGLFSSIPVSHPPQRRETTIDVDVADVADDASSLSAAEDGSGKV